MPTSPRVKKGAKMPKAKTDRNTPITIESDKEFDVLLTNLSMEVQTAHINYRLCRDLIDACEE